MSDTSTLAKPRRPKVGPVSLVRAVLDPGTASRQGTPVLDPTRWTRRHSVLLGLAVGVATVAERRLGVCAGRLAYGALFVVAVLAVVVATLRSRQDLTIGIVAAFLFGLAALFIVGSGNAFDALHAVRGDAWGRHMQFRFWG